jgi:hypothetical protein
MKTHYTEDEVRAMRDRVFGVPSTDQNWEGCRHNWTRPDSVEWLLNRRENYGL